MTSPSSTVHVFDVCGTLFREDTTLGLLRWHARRRNRYLRLALLVSVSTERSPLFWLFKVLEKLSGSFLVRPMTLLTLASEELSEVEISARQYAVHLLGKRKFDPIFAKLEQAKKNDDTVILASASISPIIDALSEKLEVYGFGSELEVRGSHYTGRLSYDMSGRKLERIHQRFGSDYLEENSSCYTDNFSDRELLQACRSRTVVLHKPGHRQRWVVSDLTFIALE